MLYVKRARVKGRVYLYFRTGRRDQHGKEILARLPDAKDPGFGNAYASYMAARTRRETMTPGIELTIPTLISLYESSPHFRCLSAGTQRLYGYSLVYLRKMLPTAPAGLLERQDVARLVDERAAQPGAANSLLRTTAAMFRWARQRGHVTNDPCRDIEALTTGEHDPWPEPAIEAALKSDDPKVRLAVALLYFTAQRIGDVCRMKWTDIRDGRVTVMQQKTGRELSIRIHGDLQRELDRHPGRIGYILAGPKGRAPSPGAIRERLQAFAAGIGVSIVPHGLRKNAVTALLEAGCSAAETASISGQSLRLVEHYAKKRDQQRLGDAAVLKWEGHKR